MIERGFDKMSFLFILVGQIVWFIFLGQYGFLWTSFCHWMCYIMYVFATSMALFKFQKRGIGYIYVRSIALGSTAVTSHFIQLFANLF